MRPLGVGILLLAALASRAGAVPREGLRHVALRATAIDGCPGIPYPRGERELFIDGDHVVDARSRFWELDRAREYRRGTAQVRYRVDTGSLLIVSELSEDLRTEKVRISIETPIEASYLRIYLNEVKLPCERHVSYDLRELGTAKADLEVLARFDALLHEATELGYNERYADVMERLRQAITLIPDDPAPYWMMARARYLELEQQAQTLSKEERMRGYEEAERWADAAVGRAPHRAEGYLWQGILRGRMATAQGNIRVALRGMLGGRGPAWLEQTLRKAVSLQEEYRFFGFSTRANALYALAQFYRLAPDAWYMAAVGTRGDIDRAVALARETVEAQPVRIEFHKELAVALLCRARPGDREEAEQHLREVLRLPAITRLDRIDQKHAHLLMRGLPNVCWYSRDSLQETAACVQ
ncbi:MAG: hypothetical protein ACE5FG_09670 [Myxococcota bacterium]